MFANFDNSYGRLPDRFHSRQGAGPARTPRLLAFNTALADRLGISERDPNRLARILSGQEVPMGADPLAQVYAGHQFGGFSPQLGDGRALLLGEIIAPDGARFDLALKGSGRTPYSRAGDGRAWLGPVLREYLLSEFMAAMGVPTTRALAAVATGEVVLRERPLPGAILTRVAASHIRVGTFEFFAARGDRAGVQTLYDHVRARHYPDAASPHDLMVAVMARQAYLIARWMGLGFIHGVMNTDNTALSGETIDYGPAAFMEAYHTDTVYSSIDSFGRYAYANQARIIVWNLAQLASALLMLEPDADAALPRWQATLNAMPAQIEAARLAVFGQKIGLAQAHADDAGLIDGLLAVMDRGQADFTNTFFALADDLHVRDQFLDPALFDAFAPAWRARLAQETDPQAVMRAANPVLVPRNHRVEDVIRAAETGDLAPFERLLAAVTDPFSNRDEFSDLRIPASPENAVRQTFCGT